MIVGWLNETARVEQMFPEMKAAFEWLRANYKTVHESGVTRVDLPHGMWANVEMPAMKAIDEQVLEVHRNYIDIHVPVDGDEVMGWLPCHKLSSEVMPYSPERDSAFYDDAPLSHITLHPGEFAIMTPMDAHAPIIGTGTLRKICIKVPVD